MAALITPNPHQLDIVGEHDLAPMAFFGSENAVDAVKKDYKEDAVHSIKIHEVGAQATHEVIEVAEVPEIPDLPSNSDK